MWCKACRQDVPGVASFDEGGFCCARCGEKIGTDPALLTATHACQILDQGVDLAEQDEPQETVAAAPPVALDDWEVEEQLRSADRLLRQNARTGQVASAPVFRFDPAHAAVHGAGAGPHFSPSQPVADPPPKRSAGVVAMLLLSLGFMGFACGGVLLGWGWIDNRQELWDLGLPIALVGQCAMLCGLLLQLERLWRSGSDTATRLVQVDQQLHDLQHTTHLLSTTHAGPAKSFYAHFSEGANPRVLLADLKGQLDLLATRLHDRA